MIQVLSIVAASWPIAFMLVGITVAVIVNRRLKQAMDDSQAVRDLHASQSMVVRNRECD